MHTLRAYVYSKESSSARSWEALDDFEFNIIPDRTDYSSHASISYALNAAEGKRKFQSSLMVNRQLTIRINNM